MVAEGGFEPPTSWLWAKLATGLLTLRVDAGAGLEPATFSLWGWRATICSTPHGDPKENRTPAFAVKGRRLKPLDYGARFQDPLPQVLSFYPSVLALLSANNLDLSTGYWLLLCSTEAGTPARLGIEPNNKFCHRTTQHLSLGSEHTYFSNTFNHNGLSKTLWWPVRESNPRLRRERPVSWPLD